MAVFSVGELPVRRFRVELIEERFRPAWTFYAGDSEETVSLSPSASILLLPRSSRAMAEVTKKGSKRFTRGNFRRSNVSAYRLENSKY